MTAAVFDCMVFLQAATNDRGPAFACLSLVETGQVALHVSPAILAEVRDVLTRPKIQATFPHLTAARVDVFLQKIAALATTRIDTCGLKSTLLKVRRFALRREYQRIEQMVQPG